MRNLAVRAAAATCEAVSLWLPHSECARGFAEFQDVMSGAALRRLFARTPRARNCIRWRSRCGMHASARDAKVRSELLFINRACRLPTVAESLELHPPNTLLHHPKYFPHLVRADVSAVTASVRGHVLAVDTRKECLCHEGDGSSHAGNTGPTLDTALSRRRGCSDLAFPSMVLISVLSPEM